MAHASHKTIKCTADNGKLTLKHDALISLLYVLLLEELPVGVLDEMIDKALVPHRTLDGNLGKIATEMAERICAADSRYQETRQKNGRPENDYSRDHATIPHG